MTINTPFTRPLHTFLISQGYTHICNIGIRPKQSESEDNSDYILIPLKPDDPRLKFEEVDMIITEITDNDVYDMADGVEFISFYVEMPVAEYEIFIK